MRNSIYQFYDIKRDQKVVKDFTSVYFSNLFNILEQYDDYFMIIELGENDRLENVSYQLYGSENYADLILACNDENFIWSSPYDQDIILLLTENILDEFREEMNIDNFDNNPSYRAFKEQVHLILDDRNSKRKKFKVPKPENLGEVLNIIDNYIKEYSKVTESIDSLEVEL
jgi:hypothetical protein